MYLGITLPAGHASDFMSFARFAQKAEQAGLDMITLSDRPMVLDDDASAGQAPAFEPTTLVSALATATRTIGLVAAASTLAFQPYNLARRFASLDLISHGRTGWLATLIPDAAEQAHFSRWSGIPAEDVRSRSEEFVGIVKGLWQGWDADALLFDKAAGRFFDPARMHVLGHQGAHFSVRGPLNVARSPQDAPVLVMSDVSQAEVDFAARMADVVLSGVVSLDGQRRLREGLKQHAAALGRDPAAIKILAGARVFVGTTTDEARRQRDAFLQSEGPAPADRIEWVGTPAGIADAMEERSQACDGFDIVAPASPDDVLDLVVPELRRRGLLRAGYGGTTLRSHLDLTGETSS
jgi:alkanesulfonate monooxygenase SsuD/methylene tetrahydromethanopterin reductase-like flavin-dependent oxidoreductase (luciferase family)